LDAAPALAFGDRDLLSVRLRTGHYGPALDEILDRLAPEAGSDSMPRGTNLKSGRVARNRGVLPRPRGGADRALESRP